MKVSVLIPIYGVEEYIEQCATSLFEQTYRDLEFIFVDDCSPDRSCELLKETAARYPARKAQIHLLHHDRNRGLGATRKTALEAATGDFVTIVDSDDYLAPDAIALLVDEQRKTQADIVTGCAQALYPDGKTTYFPIPACSKETFLKLMLIQNTVLHTLWARLIRKSLFTDYGISPQEGINQAEDYAIMPQLVFRAVKMSHMYKPIYRYRQLSGSTTFSDQISPRHVLSFLRANEAVCQHILSNDRDKKYTVALEIGMLNTYFNAMKTGLSVSQVRAVCHYTPQKYWFRIGHLLFVHPQTLKLLRFFYLSTKWCYKKKLHYHD